MPDEPKEPRLLLAETKEDRRLLLMDLDTGYSREYPVVRAYSSGAYHCNFRVTKGNPVTLDDGRVEFDVHVAGDFFDLHGTVRTTKETYGKVGNSALNYVALSPNSEDDRHSPVLIAIRLQQTWFAISCNEFPDPADPHSE